MTTWCVTQLTDICLWLQCCLAMWLCVRPDFQPVSALAHRYNLEWVGASACLGLACAAWVQWYFSAFVKCLVTEERICGPTARHISKYCNQKSLELHLWVGKSSISHNVELMKPLNAAACKCSQNYVQGERNFWCAFLFMPTTTHSPPPPCFFFLNVVILFLWHEVFEC